MSKINQIPAEFNDLDLENLALPACLVHNWHLSTYFLIHVNQYSGNYHHHVSFFAKR